jgi:hypothetical protein
MWNAAVGKHIYSYDKANAAGVCLIISQIIAKKIKLLTDGKHVNDSIMKALKILSRETTAFLKISVFLQIRSIKRQEII